MVTEYDLFADVYDQQYGMTTFDLDFYGEEAQGAQPGDMMVFYKVRPAPLPRTILGSGVVLRTSPVSSTVKIVESVRTVWIGDRVEMK